MKNRGSCPYVHSEQVWLGGNQRELSFTAAAADCFDWLASIKENVEKI